MEKISHTRTRRGGVVVQHDNAILGPACLGDAMSALGRIAAELLLDLNVSEVIPVASQVVWATPNFFMNTLTRNPRTTYKSASI
jgi:hypothetical protein